FAGQPAPAASALVEVAPGAAVTSSASAPSEPADPGATMVLVRAGSFVMGVEDGMKRHRPHRVTLSKDYWIDVRETTVGEYAECVERGACSPNTLHGRELSAEELARL